MKINGTTDTPSMDQYATKEWVQEQEYLDENELKTVNEESLVGEGDIEVGGLTPTQETALDYLVNPGNGYLRYYAIPAMTCDMLSVTGASANDPSTYYLLFTIDDDVYMMSNENQAFYKFNESIFDFEKVSDFSQEITVSYAVVWQDSQGRTYYGNTYQIDIATGTFTPLTMGGDYYEKYGCNILVGQNHIYMIKYNKSGNTAFIFNEGTQTFESTSIVDTTGIDITTWYSNMCKYEGKWILRRNKAGAPMYEFVETENGASFVALETPYFPIEITVDGTTKQLSAGMVHKIAGDYYLIYSGSSGIYKLVNGAWEEVSYTIPAVNWSGGQNLRGVSKGSLAFGYGNNYDSASSEANGKLRIWNFSTEPIVLMGWTTELPDRVSTLKNAGYATETWVTNWVTNQGYTLYSDLILLASRVTNLEDAVGDAETITNEILG